MFKALKSLAAFAITLACLYVAVELFVGFPGYARYAPIRNREHQPLVFPSDTGEVEAESSVQSEPDPSRDTTP